jgi:hypothetical protein
MSSIFEGEPNGMGTNLSDRDLRMTANMIERIWVSKV